MARKIAKRANKANPREDRQNDVQKTRNHRNKYRNENGDDISSRTEEDKLKKVRIIPRNLAQEKYLTTLEDESKSIIFAMGAAGTGKSLIATMYAIKQLQEGAVKKIIITRPAVSVDEQHGFLPGTLIEKMAPWVIPIMDIFKEHYSVYQVEKMLQNETIEVAPLAYMRGRAQPLNSIIQTPYGKKHMGDIKIGDEILGSNGKITFVTGVFPQGKKDIYRITFSDGVSTLASGDHLWMTQAKYETSHTIKTTKEIIESGLGDYKNRNHKVPVMSGPATYHVENKLAIDPYFLGVMLSDYHEKDLRIISDGALCLIENDVFEIEMQKIGLHNKKSFEMFIPQVFLHNTTENRIALLNGLMDTNGIVHKNTPRYFTVSKQLAYDVLELIRSLGGVGQIIPNEKCHKTNKDGYYVEFNLQFNPFKITKNAQHCEFNSPTRYIEKIEYIGDQDCQCISVDAKDHLYLTDDFIVTHNTLKNAIVICDEMQNATPSQMKMVLTRIGENARIIVTGDILQADRGFDHNGLRDFVDRFERKGSPYIAVCRFGAGDVERHHVIEHVLDIYGDVD